MNQITLIKNMKKLAYLTSPKLSSKEIKRLQERDFLQNLNHFESIIPCGIKDCLMTKISDFNPHVRLVDVKEIVKNIIKEEFNFKFISE